MTIKAHCMGTEFPKRDTDSPNVKWANACERFSLQSPVTFNNLHGDKLRAERDRIVLEAAKESLPSAADLDAVAEEQRVKEKTSGPLPQNR